MESQKLQKYRLRDSERLYEEIRRKVTAEKEAELEKKEAELEKKDAELAEKDARIRELEKLLADKE